MNMFWILALVHFGIFIFEFVTGDKWDYIQLVAAVAWMANARVSDLEKKIKNERE